MYNNYFGFLENPFSIAPDPRYLYMSEMHQDGLAHLKHGLSSEGCIILLTGEIGTGKTTLGRFFLERLDPTANIALIINPGLSAFELLATVCDEFRIKVSDDFYSHKHYLDALNEFLLQSHADNKPALLVIDEAQNLDKEALEMVRLLTNLETNQQKLLKIILLGQSELATALTSPDLTQVNQRITSRFHLTGLDAPETAEYIKHRLLVAGAEQKQLFSDRAVKKIHQLTGGIPRLINSLCDRSLIGAYAENEDQVDESIVKKAAKEIFGFDNTSRTIEIPVNSLVVGSLATLLVILVWVGSTSDLFHLKLSSLLPPPQESAQKSTNLETEPVSQADETAPPAADGNPDKAAEEEIVATQEPSVPDRQEPAAEVDIAERVETQEDSEPSNIFIAPVEIASKRENQEQESGTVEEAPGTRIVIKRIEIAN